MRLERLSLRLLSLVEAPKVLRIRAPVNSVCTSNCDAIARFCIDYSYAIAGICSIVLEAYERRGRAVQGDLRGLILAGIHGNRLMAHKLQPGLEL